MTIHVVQPGETVASIAAGYGVDPVRLAADNSVDRGQLAVGQTLVIRFPRRVHAVQPGETLYSISQSYGVSLRQLWRNNWSLGGNTALQPGQQLVISYLDAKLGTALLNGYAYPFIDSALLAEQLPYLTDLAPFTYGITAAGGLLPLTDEALISAARQHGTAPVMHLSTLTESGQFSTERAESVLSDKTMQAELIRQVVENMQAKGFAGLDVDFEYLPGSLSGDYAAFLARLRQILRPLGRFLWVALAPKTSAAQQGLLYEGHDYAALGRAADAALLMTYEWRTVAHKPKAIENQGILRNNIC